jgi:hypothetical protein
MKTLILAALLTAGAAPAFAQPPLVAPQGPATGPQRGHMARPLARADVQSRVQRLFARVDANRDGFVTREEIEAVRGARGGGEGLRARGPDGAGPGMRGGGGRGEGLFARLDQNRDGIVTRAEFDAAMAARAAHGGTRGEPGAERGPRGGARFGRAGMAGFGGRAFERMDLNHDGRVSVQEATGFALQAFDRADANRDGIVTPDERRAARGARRGARL